ncbi:MAG: hypothetical protein M3Z75_24980 [Actinomycetota bacterium]|nr:hypothetical protein [Actinomycetota bacterium]
MQPATAFRVTLGRAQLRYSWSTPVGDLDPDNPVPHPDRNRDRLAGNTRAAMPDTVTEKLAYQQDSGILARVPGA